MIFKIKKFLLLFLQQIFLVMGLSAILIQIQCSKEVLLACSARKITSVEQSYSSIKWELRAVLYGLMKFEKFISMSNFFFLITDAMSLKWLVTMKSSSKLFMRWSTHIFSLNFKILHRCGKIHLNADVLSREKSVLDEPTKQDCAETNIHFIFPTSKICNLEGCNICTLKFSDGSTVQKLDQKNFKFYKLSLYLSSRHFPILMRMLYTPFLMWITNYWQILIFCTYFPHPQYL